MLREKVLVLGLGEVGRPLFELLKESKQFNVYGFDTNETKMQMVGQSKENLPTKVDVMHVCIPCKNREEFVSVVKNNTERFKPMLIIIDSTVPPTTTNLVYEHCRCLVAHSPIRGVHENLEHMKWEIKRWTKYVGGVNSESTEAACKHFKRMGLKTKALKSSIEVELAKLFETTYRAWMIACFQEMHRVSRFFQADFVEIVDFLEDTHKVRLDRPIMFPDIIGGHCLIPNTELLLSVYDSKFLRLILESNEKRKEEIKDEIVKGEVEKVKKRADALQKELMRRLGKHS